MQYRKFGRTGWQVGEMGFGMWQMGDQWDKTVTPDDYAKVLDLAIAEGVNFFDTAWAYGEGKSERVLGEALNRHQRDHIYVATKVPPKNRIWPSQRQFILDDCFPKGYLTEYTERSLINLNTDYIDLQQYHVWEDAWADQDDWQEEIYQLKKAGKIKASGVSINRWEPDNCLNTLKTGSIDAVQVIYNIFDQAPEDNLFPVCQALDVAVIARVPFDEGTLTGTLTKSTTFAADDWRSKYFVPENLIPSVEHAEALKSILPAGMSLPEMALRFILHHPAVSTIIPGMRRESHLLQNIACSDAGALPMALIQDLRAHRWDRQPTWWSL